MTQTFILARNSPRNTIICNKQGFAVYRIQTPKKLSGRISTISRVVPNSTLAQTPIVKPWDGEDWEGAEHGPQLDTGDFSDEEIDGRIMVELDSQDRYTELASIEWHTVGPSKLQYRGLNGNVKDFLPTERYETDSVARSRPFTASDGKSYKWILGTEKSKLVTNDDSQRTIVKFHHRHVFREHRPASLELTDEGVNIMDDIVVTWVYIEKIRRDSKPN